MATDLGTFGLVVRFFLRVGRQEEFDALTAATVAAVNDHEPGTLLYAVHQVDGEPSQRIFYEMYRDRAAFDQHEQQPYVQDFLAKRDELLDSFEVAFLHPTLNASHLETA